MQITVFALIVHFYFLQLTAEHKCLSFEVEQDMEIEHVKPAFVHVYDYYEPGMKLVLHNKKIDYQLITSIQFLGLYTNWAKL